MIRQRVASFIQKYYLIKPGDTVIAAVSGGPDSMVLLYILNQLRDELRFTLHAAHLNHNLRETALAEEQLVEQICTDWEIKLHVHSAEVKKYAEDSKVSLELAGRELRYQFFFQLAGKYSGVIATAHHQDDAAETVFMHLLRGSGLKGLRGIQPGRDNLIRPLLSVQKEEIIYFAHLNRIPYVVDASNNDLSFTRNRIRHTIIPLIKEQFNPNIVPGIFQMSQMITEEDEFIEDETEKYWPGVLKEQQKGTISLYVGTMRTLHPVIQRRILQRALLYLQDNRPNWERHDIERIRELLNKEGSSKKVCCKDHIHAYKVYDLLLISKEEPPSQEGFSYLVSVPGTVHCVPYGRRFVFHIGNKGEKAPVNYDWKINYSIIKNDRLFLRSFQPGDTIEVAGLNGHKKIKKIFNERKIPHNKRASLPLLTTDHKVLSILGIMIAPNVYVNEQTESVLYIKEE